MVKSPCCDAPVFATIERMTVIPRCKKCGNELCKSAGVWRLFCFVAARPPRGPAMSRADDIRARWAKATPGPWDDREEAGIWDEGDDVFEAEQVAIVPKAADAEAIATAPEDVAWLLARVAELVKAARSEHRDCDGFVYARPTGMDAHLPPVPSGPCPMCTAIRALDAERKADND